jgi:hypothetical protein
MTADDREDRPENWPDFTGPDGIRFTFGRYHPSDHWPWQPRCRTFYGGWRWHLHVAWPDQKRRLEHRLLHPWWGWTLCKMGVHRTYVGHVGNDKYRKGFFVACWFCDWDRSATEDEWFHYPGGGGILGG